MMAGAIPGGEKIPGETLAGGNTFSRRLNVRWNQVKEARHPTGTIIHCFGENHTQGSPFWKQPVPTAHRPTGGKTTGATMGILSLIVKRFPFLDWMRGLAIVIMIQCHTFNSFVRRSEERRVGKEGRSR